MKFSFINSIFWWKEIWSFLSLKLDLKRPWTSEQWQDQGRRDLKLKTPIVHTSMRTTRTANQAKCSALELQNIIDKRKFALRKKNGLKYKVIIKCRRHTGYLLRLSRQSASRNSVSFRIHEPEKGNDSDFKLTFTEYTTDPCCKDSVEWSHFFSVGFPRKGVQY